MSASVAPRGATSPPVIAFVREALKDAQSAATPTPSTAVALADADQPDWAHVDVIDLADASEGSLEVLLLAAEELSVAGAGAETLLHRGARLLQPAGRLIASVNGALAAELTALAGRSPRDGRRHFRAAELAAMVGHLGLLVEHLAAPGAAALVTRALQADAGPAHDPRYDPEHDRQPGILDAGPTLAIVARAARSPQERSERFFASLPRKLISASALCHDRQGRLLLVHDTFKQRWTLPGGVVDATENPADAAARETWEEAGVRVTVERLVGAFAADGPDRVALVFATDPLAEAPQPVPVHAHEVDASGWFPLPVALQRLREPERTRLQRCLLTPGRSWLE